VRKQDHEYFDKLKGKYQGERLFVIGTGPSLRNEIGAEVNELGDEREFTFGVNLLAHCITGEDAFIDFIPDFWGVGEIDWLRNIESTIAGFKTEKILSCFLDPEHLREGMNAANSTKYSGPLFPDWHWLWRPEYKKMKDGWFSGFDEELYWAADGGSVVFDVCVQLGAWMGFDTIYLLGCETTVTGHAYGEIYEPPERDKERQGLVQASAYVARKEFEKRGKKLIDLSGGTGTLPLEKGKFKDVMGISKKVRTKATRWGEVSVRE